MTEILLTVFMGLTALAIVIQMGVLIALFVSFQKASERLQSLLPMIRDTKILLAETTPKVRGILDNLAVLSATARQDAERISSTANEITDRVREQVVRADELGHTYAQSGGGDYRDRPASHTADLRRHDWNGRRSCRVSRQQEAAAAEECNAARRNVHLDKLVNRLLTASRLALDSPRGELSI